MTLRDKAMLSNKNLSLAEIAAPIESDFGKALNCQTAERTGFGLCFSGDKGHHFFGKSSKRLIIMPALNQRP